MGSYLQKPVVQKESYEGTGQEFGLQEFLDLSFLNLKLTEANHGIHAPDYSVLGSTGSGA